MYYVVYNTMKDGGDKFLHVTNDIYKNGDKHVFSGTLRECRKYIIEHQKDYDTPSIFTCSPKVINTSYDINLTPDIKFLDL